MVLGINPCGFHFINKMKKGKNKLFVIIGISVGILLIASMIATASEDSLNQISGDIKNYVETFIEKKGIAPESVNNVTEVNFDNLPKEVNIDKVNDNNIAIYQINYNKTSEQQKNIFVVTYSVDKVQSQGDVIINQNNRELLNFGFNEESKEPAFLKTANGVQGSLDKGYVMMRSGSIVGMSTNLEITEGTGTVEIVIYKNGKLVNFGNTIIADSNGVEKDYDTQSKGTVPFEAGDVISLYAKSSAGITWKDVNTLLEITTN